MFLTNNHRLHSWLPGETWEEFDLFLSSRRNRQYLWRVQQAYYDLDLDFTNDTCTLTEDEVDKEVPKPKPSSVNLGEHPVSTKHLLLATACNPRQHLPSDREVEVAKETSPSTPLQPASDVPAPIPLPLLILTRMMAMTISSTSTAAPATAASGQ